MTVSDLTDLDREILHWRQFAVNFAFRWWNCSSERSRDANPLRDEIVSHSLQALWDALLTHDPGRSTSLQTYICVTVRNRMVDLRRKNYRSRFTRFLPGPRGVAISTLDGFDPPARSPGGDELAVRAGLELLSPEQREILERRFLNGEDERAVRQDLGGGRTAFYFKTRKALQRLRELVEGQ